MELDAHIEGILFYKTAPVKITDLEKLCDASSKSITEALSALATRLLTGGTRLLRSQSHVQLVTAPELDATIETIRKDDLTRTIGKAGAETLAIILYRGPISRADIDAIRGVNSNFIIRNLLTRGLVERIEKSSRSFVYGPTTELLQHLGITERESLPRFSEIMNSLDTFETAQNATNESS